MGETKTPVINIYALGGCGINILDKLYDQHLLVDDTKSDKVNPEEYNMPTPYALDTSLSNLEKVNENIFGEDKERRMLISDIGAGKDRSSLQHEIQKYIDRHKVTDTAKDINILIFSLSGGSGSVIGPMLAYEFAKRGKAVIIVGVIDVGSRQDCTNSIDTMKELDATARKYGQYYPLMLFNNVGVGRRKVNAAAVQRILEALAIFSDSSIEELDYSDRMRFLRPTKENGAPGMYLLGVSAKGASEKDQLEGEVGVCLQGGDALHAYIAINQDGLGVDLLANVGYIGIVNEEREYFAAVGVPIPNNIFQLLKDNAERFERNEAAKTSAILESLTEAD